MQELLPTQMQSMGVPTISVEPQLPEQPPSIAESRAGPSEEVIPSAEVTAEPCVWASSGEAIPSVEAMAEPWVWARSGEVIRGATVAAEPWVCGRSG
jgi:hypothetical protein